MNSSRQSHLLALLLAAFASVSAFAANSDRKTADLDMTQFQKLFTSGPSVEESIRRFQNIEKLRQEAQASLDALLKKRPSDVELKLRYAELLMQRSRDLEQLGLDLVSSGRSAEGQKASALSKNLAREGLRYHSQVLAKNSRHSLAGKIYLAMGRSEVALRNPKGALRNADLGIQSAATTDAETLLHLWILRGDVSFDVLNLKNAYESYKKAESLAKAASLEEAYVAYKMAWVYYNTKETPRALALLEKVMELSRDKFALKQEAISDYGIFVADLDAKSFDGRGGAKGIYTFLEKRSDSESARKALVSMANFIAKNGKRENAVKSLEFLLDQDKLGKENLDYALQIVEWTHHFADKSRLVKRYLWLLEGYGPQSAWYTHYRLDPALQENASDRVEAALRVYAEALHKEALENKNPGLREKEINLVLSLYEAHSSVYPDISSIHFYAADIHRDRQAFAQAARHYDHFIRIMELKKPESRSKLDREHLEESYTGSVAMWARAVEKDSKVAGEMLKSVDHFLTVKAQHPKAAEIALGAAKTEASFGSPAAALVRLDRIIKDFPRSHQSSEAVHASLDLLAKSGDLTNVSLKAREWLANIDTWAVPSEKSKLRSDLEGIFSRTEAKTCEAMAGKSSSTLEAALCYQAFAPRAPTPALAARAYLLAADNFEKANDINGAWIALEALVYNHPQSTESLSGFSRLAVYYEKSFQFEKAVKIYESMISRKDVKDREKITHRLLTLLHGLGRDDLLEQKLRSKDSSEALKREFKGVAFEDRFQSLLREEHLHGYGHGQLKSARAQSIFRDMSSRESMLDASQRLEMYRIRGHIEWSRGSLASAEKHWKAGLRYFQSLSTKNQSSWDAGAKLRIESLLPLSKNFYAVSLKNQAQKKISLFQKLDRAYSEILSLNSPSQALEALAKSSELYFEIARQAKSAGVPAHQVALYERKAFEVRRQLGLRARSWKMMTPTVVAIFRSGQEEGPATFPWFDLPRWMDLSEDQKDWSEWGTKTSRLEDKLKKNKNRRDTYRSAFILLSRKATLKDPRIAQQAQTWTDRPGVQLRIQAHMNDGELEKAILFLKQYVAYFGEDAFAEHQMGRLDWLSGNYSGAYTRWSRSKFTKDFRSVYWTQGWVSLIDYLMDGRSSPRRQADVFAALSPLVQDRWQKQYLASLCLLEAIRCEGDYEVADSIDLLKKDPDDHYAYEVADARSLWSVQKGSLSFFVEKNLDLTQKKDEMKIIKRALDGLSGLKANSINSKKVEKDFEALKKRVDRKTVQLENEEKSGKALASVRNPSSAKATKAPRVVYEKKTKIDLTEKDVDGQILKPDGQAIRGDQNLTFDSLLDSPKNFNNQMKRNSGAL